MIGRTYVAVFLLALTSLATEVLLTRVFDVLLWHNLSFMVISCAVFGLALGGLIDVVAPPAAESLERAGLHRLALGFAGSVWAIPLLLNAIPFSVDRAAHQPVAQLGWFLLLYVVLLAPFFFMGWCLCRVFSLAPRHIQPKTFVLVRHQKPRALQAARQYQTRPSSFLRL